MRIKMTMILSGFIILLITSVVFGATMISPTEDQQVDAGSWITIIVKPDPGEEWVNFVAGFTPLEYDPGSQVYKLSVQIPNNKLGYRTDLRVYGLDKSGNEVWLTRRVFVKLPSNVVLQGIEAGDAGSDFISLRIMPEGSKAIDVEHFSTRQLTTHGRYSDGVKRELTSSASGSTYTSNNTSIAIVDSEGLVKAVSPGKTIITVSNSGKKMDIDIMVFLSVDPPKNFAVSSVPTGLQLTWHEPQYDADWELEYEIYRSNYNHGLREKLIATLPKGTTNYIDTDSEVGKTYYYRMVATIKGTTFGSRMTGIVSGTRQ